MQIDMSDLVHQCESEIVYAVVPPRQYDMRCTVFYEGISINGSLVHLFFDTEGYSLSSQ